MEYELDRISQTEVSKSFSFADGLVGFMRQAPKYILVGEINDRPSFKAAMYAASTGHLVFSTLHANNTDGIFSRANSFAEEKELEDFKKYLLFGSAQRLLPKLCDYCKLIDERESSKEDLLYIYDETFKIFKPKGCEFCSHKGVNGRELVFEFGQKNRKGNFIIENSMKTSVRAMLLEGKIDIDAAYSAICI